MLIIYQRYHTLFNLLLLALIGVASGLLAGSLVEAALGVRPPTNRLTTAQDRTESQAITQADLDQILQGNIFDPAGRRADVRFSPGKGADPDNPDASEPVAQQQQDMDLLGTVVAGRQSLALIQIERELEIYHLEDSLPGDLVIAEILRNQVKLRHPDGSLTTLMMAEDEPDNARQPKRRATTATAPSADEIRQVDENSWLVSRETVEKTRENLAQELRLAQMQPRVVNGQTDGFLVRMIKRQSILNKLGLRRGDVVMSINNIELNSPEKALQIFQQLREARQIEVAIERRGEAMNFSYQLD